MRRFPYERVLLGLTLLFLLADVRETRAADDKEPSYGGKRLSEWLKGLDSRDYHAGQNVPQHQPEASARAALADASGSFQPP